MSTTIFDFAPTIGTKNNHFIYSVDECQVIEYYDNYNHLPLPMPSHMYIHIVDDGLTNSSLFLRDNKRIPMDIPKDIFWVIENHKNSVGENGLRVLIEPETVKLLNNDKNFFKLGIGKSYQIVYNGKTILTIEPHRSWKITFKQ
jgi:hypothetical protein